MLRGFELDGVTPVGPYSSPEIRFDAVTDDPIPASRLVYVNGIPRLGGNRDCDRQVPPPSILFTYDPELGFPTKAAGDYSEEDSLAV